jgi:urease accessory protein
MILEKILGNLNDAPTTKRVERFRFDWHERDKKILRKVIVGTGEEIGLKPDRPLSDGDILYADGDRVIAAELTPAPLIAVAVADMIGMGRVCCELGNRHLPVAIGETAVRVPFDKPTFDYLTKLGFVCRAVTERFTPTVGGAGHAHG